MNDDVTEQQTQAPHPIPLAAGGLAAASLEPLAVPIGRFGSILRRQIWLVGLVIGLVVGGAVAYVKTTPRLFNSEVSILVEPQRTQVSDLQAISPEFGDVGGLVRTQIDILRSQALVINVVRALDLERVPEFVPKGGPMQTVTRLIQRVRRQPATEDPPLARDTAIEVAAGMLAGKMSFLNEARSSVLRVSVTTEDPALSAMICNEIGRQYLEFKRRAKFAAMQRAHDWLQEQMRALTVQLRADDAAVEQYRREHGLDEQGAEESGAAKSATINRQQLDTISRQMIDVSRDRARKEGQLQQAQAAARGDMRGSALPEVLAAPGVVQLMAQISTAAGREAQLAASQGAGNPELAATRAQLRRLQLRMEQEVGTIIASLSSDLKAAQLQEESLRRQMVMLRADVSVENSAQTGLQSLQTKARATRSIYESFLTRATQLANVSGIQEPDASLVSEARIPLGPSAPKSTRIVLVAAILSAALGVVLACLRERLRHGFSQPEQLETALGLPLVGMLPSVPARTFRGARRGRSGVAMTATLDKLRGQLRAMGEDQPKVLMVTSAIPQEGKSVFAAELARNAARSGWRVLLIECDFGCGSMARHFRLKPGAGLCQILAGDSIGDRRAFVHEPEPGLNLILGGAITADPQEQLASKRMSALLHETRSRYDLVLLDTPPVLPVADALVLARQVDATLLVVRWEKTGRAAVHDALRLLNGSRARLMGVVMTRVHLGTAVKSGGRLAHGFSRYGGYHVNRSGRA